MIAYGEPGLGKSHYVGAGANDPCACGHVRDRHATYWDGDDPAAPRYYHPCVLLGEPCECRDFIQPARVGWVPQAPPTWVQVAFLRLVNTRILALGGPVVGCERCAVGDGYFCNRPDVQCMVRVCPDHAYTAPDCNGESNLMAFYAEGPDFPWAVRDGLVRCPAHRTAGDILIGSYPPEVVRLRVYGGEVQL